MKKEILITPVSQLIDLNSGMKNFQTVFKVVSDGHFMGVVVTQSMLDSGDIQYRNANQSGDNFVLSGQVKNDTNQYNNYYLVLKTDDDVVAEVTVNTQELKVAPEFAVPKWAIYSGVIGGVIAFGLYMSKNKGKKSVNPSLLDNLMKSVEK